MSGWRRVAAGVGAVLLLLGAVVLEPPATPRAGGVLTPLAALLRNVEWIRFQRALLRGDEDRALLHAQSALALDPSSTEGWRLLATHLALFRGSPERELELGRRRAWFAAGLETSVRGARRADRPEELHLWRGLLCLGRAELDPAVHPGGRPALLALAAEAFEAARRAGSREAAELAAYAGELLSRIDAGP